MTQGPISILVHTFQSLLLYKDGQICRSLSLTAKVTQKESHWESGISAISCGPVSVKRSTLIFANHQFMVVTVLNTTLGKALWKLVIYFFFSCRIWWKLVAAPRGTNREHFLCFAMFRWKHMLRFQIMNLQIVTGFRNVQECSLEFFDVLLHWGEEDTGWQKQGHDKHRVTCSA